MAIGNLLTTAEAAEVLGITDSRVRQLYLAGRLRGKKIGTILLFSEDDVEAFAAIERPTGRPKQPS